MSGICIETVLIAVPDEVVAGPMAGEVESMLDTAGKASSGAAVVARAKRGKAGVVRAGEVVAGKGPVPGSGSCDSQATNDRSADSLPRPRC